MAEKNSDARGVASPRGDFETLKAFAPKVIDRQK